MSDAYIIGIDQSTQGTKALCFDKAGFLVKRVDIRHRQIINEKGWVSHDPMEIYHNTIDAIKKVVAEAKIPKDRIACIGISNQRETTVAWDNRTRRPVADAVVWQCSRAAEICERIEREGKAELIRKKTGIPLSPYFPAAKIAWILEHVKEAGELVERGRLCHGTIDSWLVYMLTGGKSYKTDYSNASRTQLFNLETLKWDQDICRIFGIRPENLPEVCDSDSLFGETDVEGFLEKPIPIHSVLGDSHGALFAQGCLDGGMMKATYGTGSSVMMNIGNKPLWSSRGLVTSLAWGRGGKVDYVLEGNINYTGAVVTWLKEDLELLESPKETEGLCQKAQQDDELYLVPAFTGLGAPYWRSDAKGAITGITRTTKKAEIVRAGIESIVYQIRDIVTAMEQDTGLDIKELRVDGGPTKNSYLMQFQSDILSSSVLVSESEELSGIGAAYTAGIAIGCFGEDIFHHIKRKDYKPSMEEPLRQKKIEGWKQAVEGVLYLSQGQTKGNIIG